MSRLSRGQRLTALCVVATATYETGDNGSLHVGACRSFTQEVLQRPVLIVVLDERRIRRPRGA